MILIGRTQHYAFTLDDIGSFAGRLVDVPRNLAVWRNLGQQYVGLWMAILALENFGHDASDSRVGLPRNVLQPREMEHIHKRFALLVSDRLLRIFTPTGCPYKQSAG